MAHNLVLFYIFGAIAVLSSLLVIAQPNPIYSVLLLIAASIGLAGLYVFLGAPFVAVMQIVVHGVMMVLFLFVVMLLNVPPEDATPPPGIEESSGARTFGTVLAVILGVEFVWALWGTGSFEGRERESAWSLVELGSSVFRDYAIAVEATLVLILVAVVGGVVLTGHRISRESGIGRRESDIHDPTPESRLPNPAQKNG